VTGRPKKWCDGWWAEHEKAKKTALPTIHNVKKKAKAKKKGKGP
jgi:hypothetical protein